MLDFNKKGKLKYNDQILILGIVRYTKILYFIVPLMF